MAMTEPTISQDAFDRVLTEAIIRPAGRKFRGEPSRQVAILRLLQEHGTLSFDALHARLGDAGVLRSNKEDVASRRKLIRQAISAINDKLGAFFFRARDVRLLAEMFRIATVGDDSDQPAAVLQDFFGIRKTSGVRFFASSDEPAGSLTRELFELVTELRPRELAVYASSFSTFLSNPEFTQLLRTSAASEDANLRFLLLDPESEDVLKIDRALADDPALRGAMKPRIQLSLAQLQAVRDSLAPPARDRVAIRTTKHAPLWRFRMIFLADVLHLRLTVPGTPAETLIKLDAGSSLHQSLRDVFDRAWEDADIFMGRPGSET